MSYTPSSNRATQRYRDKSRARIYLDVPKKDKERYQKEAGKRGLSLSRFVTDSIENEIKRGVHGK